MSEFSEIPSEIIFPSGKAAHFLFARTEILESESQLDEIEELKSFSIQGPLTEDMNSTSPRYREFLLSRYLLLKLFKDFKRKEVRGLAFSLSHTKDAAIVVGHGDLALSGASLARGVGVDLELKQRKISESAWKRILIDPSEKTYSPLQLWCLKEAAFKAHPKNQTTNNGLLLSDFLVRDSEIFCKPSGLRFEFQVIERSDYLLTFARNL